VERPPHLPLQLQLPWPGAPGLASETWVLAWPQLAPAAPQLGLGLGYPSGERFTVQIESEGTAARRNRAATKTHVSKRDMGYQSRGRK